MLVFTRKSGQSLMIGDEVEIKIVSVGNDQVRIGIEAPRQIPVHRREVYDSIRNQQLSATGNQDSSRKNFDRAIRKKA